MSEFYLKVGDTVSFSKTISESDVYQYAGITGDFSWNHTNEAFMAKTAYGRRIAHGALLIGFMSTTSTLIVNQLGGGVPEDETPVSLGYDRIRFVGAVFLGDTITVTYTITGVDTVKRRTNSDVTVANQRGETVAVANHILKWVPVTANLAAAAE